MASIAFEEKGQPPYIATNDGNIFLGGGLERWREFFNSSIIWRE
jgi:hypothetical protein